MPSYFSVIQFVPDVVGDERINIGAVTFGEDGTFSRFLRNWQRVKAFGSGDITFLQQFAREITDATSGSTLTRSVPANRLGGDELRLLAQRWNNSIRVTEPRASLLSAAELVDDIADRFLRESTTQRRARRRGRSAAASLAVSSMSDALEHRLGRSRVRDVLKQRQTLQGRLGESRFDFTLANGSPFLAGQALSFEIPDDESLRQMVDAVAWSFRDLAERQANVARAAVLLPPPDQTETYAEALTKFADLKVEVVSEDALPAWSEQAADRAASVLAH